VDLRRNAADHSDDANVAYAQLPPFLGEGGTPIPLSPSQRRSGLQ
jgi:hypothetical protein